MRTVTVNVTYKYELEINDENSIVKEYEDENTLLVDCASYHFGHNLPVIANAGVKVTDIELVEVT